MRAQFALTRLQSRTRLQPRLMTKTLSYAKFKSREHILEDQFIRRQEAKQMRSRLEASSHLDPRAEEESHHDPRIIQLQETDHEELEEKVQFLHPSENARMLARVAQIAKIMAWSEEDVCNWLADIGAAYEDYEDLFIAHGINGEELLDEEFSDKELEEMGVYSSMHRKRLLKEIKKLKHNNDGLSLLAGENQEYR